MDEQIWDRRLRFSKSYPFVNDFDPLKRYRYALILSYFVKLLRKGCILGSSYLGVTGRDVIGFKIG